MAFIGHPSAPRSNITKIGAYDPEKYFLKPCSEKFQTSDVLLMNCPPSLTQGSVSLYLRPTTKELDEDPPKPTVAEFPNAVIDRMVKRDNAFFVDKPGSNAYALTDAFNRCGMTSEKVLPISQAVFPRSYQYDLDCVKYRRTHACDGLKQTGEEKKSVSPHCLDCKKLNIPALTPFQLAWAKDPGQKRWKYYPDLTAKMTSQEIQKLMNRHGLPFQSEACNWYNKNYPSAKYNIINRKFSK